jgi:DNA-binding response OmpR family regulator
VLTIGDVVLDMRQRTLTCQGASASLTAREYAVIELLMRKAGCLVTRAEIEEELYGFDDHIASNAIEVHIHNLRRKLGARFITNLKGRGYRVENPR